MLKILFSVYSGLITSVCPQLDRPQVQKEPKEVDKASEKADRRLKQAGKSWSIVAGSAQ